MLDEMPLSEPSPLLTERVMRRVQSAETPEIPKIHQVGRRKQWVNSFVAIAATVLLMQSGIINKIMNIDSGITQITSYIQQLTRIL
jgi:hypothetical protein